MMLLVSVVREWPMLLTGKGDRLYNLSVQHYLPTCANMLNPLGCFHVVRTKMENPILLNGMRKKAISLGITMD